MTRAPERPELDELLKKAKEAVEKMTPEERAAMMEEQKKSFVRGMMARCEHNMLDFETCPKCRGWE